MEKNEEKLRYLPDDLVTPILEILPVKSLMRFLSVSKSFSSKICSTTFVTTHLNRSQNLDFFATTVRRNRLALYLNGEPPCKVYNFPNVMNSEYVKVVGSCNGILCLLETSLENGRQSLFLWNPLVSRIIQVPPSILGSSLKVIGFGCGPTSSDYKLVIFSDSFGRVELYTVRSKTWKILTCPLWSKFHVLTGDLFSSPYVNGKIHWLLRARNDFLKYAILCFDVGDETFKELNLPHQIHGTVNLKSFKGLLSIVPPSLHRQNPWPFPIWVMKEYGKAESCEILFDIDFDSGLESSIVVGYRNYGEVLLLGKDFELYLYADDTQETRKLTPNGEPCMQAPFWGTYKESLGLLDLEDENSSPSINKNKEQD